MLEWGQALAKLLRSWVKSLSLNMLSLKKASSRKNTWANEGAPAPAGGGSSCSRVRVRPPSDSRSKASGFRGSDWPLWERPGGGAEGSSQTLKLYLY